MGGLASDMAHASSRREHRLRLTAQAHEDNGASLRQFQIAEDLNGMRAVRR